MAEASESDSKALILGISGVSSSGKTTLARLLRDIFPRAFILHEDDFYKTDAEIPVNEDGVADWDCLESIDIPAFEKALQYIRENGMSPPDFTSKEDRNSVGQVNVDRVAIEDMKWKASKWMFADAPPIAIIDGFLLYSEGMKSVRVLFDIKLFLRTDYQTAKSRREARSGYVTLEGFWEDPPGYVDNVVWPNYVKDHAFLFKDGDVEGGVNESALDQLKIRAMPQDAQGDMTACLQWAYEVLDEALEHFTESRRPS
ncbi:Nicotinamide riboside kinase [Fulvia fulva]|uniref:Nicotinamide riboside kinase n=1 Tax=Passalora fulva TaxID=5499 RepID=A0A9Q8L767_PASFU|nr:Nicotinamide riboside kinase [Fulvia fulva]KAK4636060.1 Nicotinamide riboside kinase [Fulvia fulva]KAK4637221.1 Nicotinamide riboside kinase [Fulvia fulva]UJO12070.1 Nicotinamide riboside kinase [Fulvia fulva]WPV08854.1 Nicotinamide riboside kinase [Fulvia fulva]WPV24474.1 Nicotinamide riboside kinase [Fulvia fulva]